MKTLKDLDYLPDEDGWKVEIRQAAIEWGRRAMEGMRKFLPEEGEMNSDFAYWSGQKNLICDFFNLTNEDLK